MDLVKTAELKADKLEHYLQVDSCTFIISPPPPTPPPAAGQPASHPPVPACQAQGIAVLSGLHSYNLSRPLI